MPLELHNVKFNEIAEKGDKDNINQIFFLNDFTGTPLIFACKTNNIELVEKLLKKGADANKTYIYKDRYSHIKKTETPLFLACRTNNVELAKLLLENGADANKTYKTQTPLFLACKTNNVELAKLLLEKGADVNYRLSEGGTYLHEACKDRYVEMVELLIEKGADLNIKEGKNGRVPLHEVCAVDKFKDENTSMLRLLIQKGADVNCLTYCGRTPLILASNSGCIDAVRLLVENGADINKTECDGETPLYCAVDNDHIEIVKFLTQNGADVNVIFYENESDVESDDEDDEIEEDNRIPVTPLSKAVKENHIEIAKHLILYILLNDPREKPDYITGHTSLSDFWDITWGEFNSLLSDKIDELAERFILADLNRIIQKVEQARNKSHNREAVPGAGENASKAFLIKNRLEELKPVVEKIHKHYLNLSTRLRFISKSEEEVTLNFMFHREICSYFPARDIKKLLSASLSSKSESVTITDTMVQSNTVDSLHSKSSSSLEQEDNKHSLQSLEERAKENISTIEDNIESISNVTGSPSSSGLFANRKRKQDESSNEDPEMNKLRRLEH